MTTVAQVISDAFRQSNLISINGSITGNQQSEALRLINRIIASIYGNEAGEKLDPFPLGINGISRPMGYPWYNNTPANDWYVPKDVRLMLNITAATTVYLHPRPDDGTRLGIVDISGNLANFPLTISGNGRLIEGSPSLICNTNSMNRDWFYRQETGTWYKVTDLILSDPMPFPEDFDDMFVLMLALRLNPSYGVQMDQQSMQVLTRARSQFRARYNIVYEKPTEDGITRMPYTVVDRYRYTRNTTYGDATSNFDRGVPW